MTEEEESKVARKTGEYIVKVGPFAVFAVATYYTSFWRALAATVLICAAVLLLCFWLRPDSFMEGVREARELAERRRAEKRKRTPRDDR